ncbi:MAG TPA: bifunctional hydroxymethylpyrimidine kinase/phosphomethylpyrimidine kinase, partial [Prevotella sp.]
YDIPASTVSGQIEAIINDMQPEIVKIGMIRSVEVLNVLIDVLRRYKPRAVIYDPVVRSSGGELLITTEVLGKVITHLVPLCTLIIVKKTDAESIVRHQIVNFDDERIVAEQLKAIGCQEVLLLEDNSFHGLGNQLSSAIAYYLSVGDSLSDAIAKGQTYISHRFVRLTDRNSRSDELYNDFVNLVNTYARTNSDVAFYADRLNVSARYLAQVTKRIASIAPKQMIDDCLIHEIETELRTTKKTIQQVAYDFSFSSQAHFTKFFRKMNGCSPSEYRKRK